MKRTYIKPHFTAVTLEIESVMINESLTKLTGYNDDPYYEEDNTIPIAQGGHLTPPTEYPDGYDPNDPDD